MKQHVDFFPTRGGDCNRQNKPREKIAWAMSRGRAHPALNSTDTGTIIVVRNVYVHRFPPPLHRLVSTSSGSRHSHSFCAHIANIQGQLPGYPWTPPRGGPDETGPEDEQLADEPEDVLRFRCAAWLTIGADRRTHRP